MKKSDVFSMIEASVKQEASNLNFRKILVALSGGADSIATAYALKRVGLEIKALHCNFHLRGRESNDDQTFVKRFCEKNSIPLSTIDFDVDSYKEANPGVSVEMACRNLRHEWFSKILMESGYDRLATGHNADDNIETFFLNMLRGSGSRGLKGMERDNGKIWRPLLSFHRKEILSFLDDNKLDYVVDSTNLQSDYRRNFLRNEIIPLLKEKWLGFDTAMDKTISNLETENNLIEHYLNNILKETGSSLEVSTILESWAPLLLIKRFLDPYGPFVKTPEEVLSAINANKPHIRRWRLKKGILILRNGKLFIEIGHGKSRS
ncbi:MAG: tRNA lysidine(34) synthetase TilS [Muribaculaceae bacterium]|nr:tRNA lysidine(34) synthetase TilS [Muribaculaceae bacterium]